MNVLAKFVGTFLFLIVTIVLGYVISEITGSVRAGAWIVTIWITLLSVVGKAKRAKSQSRSRQSNAR